MEEQATIPEQNATAETSAVTSTPRKEGSSDD